MCDGAVGEELGGLLSGDDLAGGEDGGRGLRGMSIALIFLPAVQ